MHARIAGSLLAVAACAHAPAAPVGNRDASPADAPPAHVDRPSRRPLPVIGNGDYAVLKAALRAAPGTCLYALQEASTDRAAFFARTAAMAGSADRCRLAAEEYMADLALALDRDGADCRAGCLDVVWAWGIVARLASTPVHRRRALRNRAEALWRQLDHELGWSAARGAEVARAFREAAAAGDRGAEDAEVDAWINALVAGPPGELPAVVRAARARHGALADRDRAARLHAAIDAAGARL